MTDQQQTVAVLGAGGILGYEMARNLALAGFHVRAWNRTHDKALPLVEDGAHVFETAHEAVRGADVILSILFDADATQAVLAGDVGALSERAEDAVWLQMATLGPDGTDACIALAGELGLPFVDAPVAGTRKPAQEGKLVILGSGDVALREAVDPIFEVVGARTIWAGAAGAGTRLKLVVNAWLISVIEGVAETFAFAEGIGVDPQQFLDAVGGGPLDTAYLGLKGKAITDRDFAPSFTLSGGAKDARLVADQAAGHGLDLPILAAIADRFAQAAEHHGDEDVIATYRLSAPKTNAA